MTNKKRILITGASRGIGRAVALELADAGFAVTVTARRPSETMDAVISALKEKDAFSSVLYFDVGDRAAARTALEADIEALGAYWGVVVNAGINRDGAFPALTDEDWDSVINVDLSGFYNVVQPVVMPMIGLRQGGRIVTMSSVSGIMGNRGQVNYSAAKAGVIGATKALAVELAKRRITVNCVAPGLIETDMIEMHEKALEAAMSMIPLKRMGRPEEIAATVRFLMSEGAAYITRQVISVNGGML
jgi:3-oxoacyl-[acyl-carrier protein] reductase